MWVPQPYIHGLGQSTAQVQQLIASTAAGYGIPGLPDVALAVASHESGFQPGAQNPGSSAAGLFQLTAATQKTMGVTDPYDPTQNAGAGVALLARYYQQYGNWSDALQAFSEGSGNVGNAPSAQTTGLISYVNSYVPSGLYSAPLVAGDQSSGDTGFSFGNAALLATGAFLGGMLLVDFLG